jgi:hypothetical protein
LDVESSEEEELPESSALQVHNAIHGQEKREIVTPNVLGTSRFNMKAFCHFCFLGVSRCVREILKMLYEYCCDCDWR